MRRLFLENILGRKVLVLLLILSFSIPILNPESFSEVIDRVVAVVNNDIITLSELNEEVEIFLNELSGAVSVHDGITNPDEIKRRALGRLIDEMLMEQEAKNQGIVTSEREIDDAIEKILKKSSISKQEMIDRLASDGLSLDKYKERMKREMEKSELVEYEIQAKVTVSEDAIKRYYIENMESFRATKRVRAQHILLSIPPNTDEATTPKAYEKTRDLLARIQSGEDFGELAKIYSQGPSANSGGDMGWFKRGEIIPFLEKVVFNLKVGEVSDVIQSPLGLHVIKLMDKEEGEIRPLEEVKQEIKDLVFVERVETDLKKWLKTLRKRAFVKIKL